MQEERKKSEKEGPNPSNPIDQKEREPFREPKRPFDPPIDREEEAEREIEEERPRLLHGSPPP